MIRAAIGRNDGDSGLKGAIVGTVAESALRVPSPLVATYALGWAVQYGVGKLWRTIAHSTGRVKKAAPKADTP